MVKARRAVDFAQNGKRTRGPSKTVKVRPPPAEALLDEVVPIAELIRPMAVPGGAEEGGSDAWSASPSGGSSPGSDDE